MSINTTASEEGAYLSADELTLYFSSDRPGSAGDFDVFTAVRATREAMFGNVQPLASVNTVGPERFPAITADGLTLFAQTFSGASRWDIVSAQRTSLQDAFGALVATAINTNSDDEVGSLAGNDRALYLTSTRDGSYDLYRAPRTNGVLGAPVKVVGMNLDIGGSLEAKPVVSRDELTLYFASDRPGGLGVDIYMTTRAGVSEGFGPPVHLSQLSSPMVDVPDWVSADGCELYFTTGTATNFDLYVARRGP